MSRCFPFPPRGYEKKPTTDEPDLLKKEKRKEKKHKKDKKDKEKKESKEKREKDKSEGKHKEKKEKKEKKDKHRDKKDKEKGKISTSNEKKVSGQIEDYNGDNLHNNEKSGSSTDKKSSVPLQNGEYNDQIHRSSALDDKKSSILQGQNGELLARNRIKADDTENFKFVQELGRRIRDEEKGTGSHQFIIEGRKNNINKPEIQKTDRPQPITGVSAFGGYDAIQSKINGATPPPLDKKIDDKEKLQEKEGDDKRGGKRKSKDRDKERHTEKEKKEKSKEKSEKKKAERDKNKHVKKPDIVASFSNLSAHRPENSFQGLGIEGNFKKRKDMETNGVFHENEPRPNKMARHISNISPENGRKLDFPQNLGSSLSDKQTASQGASVNSFKASSKDQRVFNGMITPPVPPGSVSATKPSISSLNHTPAKSNPLKSPPVITNHIPATKPPVNHIAAQPLPIPAAKPPPENHIAAQLPPIPATKPPPPPLPVPKKKPPHPDTKYLNQILSVPKLDQWCGLDDQEWLFSGKTDQEPSKKTTMEDLQVQVWSEAKHIESVDVCALPYVIPY